MKKIKYIVICFLPLFFISCTLINKGKSDNGVKDLLNNYQLNYNGSWQVIDVYDLSEGEFYTEEYKKQIIGKEIQLSTNKIQLFSIIRNNINYKLKVVDKNYVLSYENNIDFEDFIGNKDYMDIISVIENNTILCEFWENSNGQLIMLYNSLILKLNKISNNTSFTEEDKKNSFAEENNASLNNIYNYDIINKDVGVMLAIKKPRQLKEDGSYSKEQYRSIWIPYEDDKIGTVYEKDNIIFPRLNGIWQLSKKEASKDKHIEYFEVKAPDGKVISKIDSNINNNIYKSIEFIGNDYIAIEKYEGNNFSGKYNQYQIIPIDNINSNNGVSIDEIYEGDIKGKFKEVWKNTIDGIDTKDSSLLKDTIDYTNIKMDRNEGKWILKGKIPSKNNIEEGIDFNLPVKPNNKLINFNSLFISWKSLLNQVMFLKDAFISPNNSIAIIQFDNFIAIYKIEDGELIESPLFSLDIDKDEEIIMAEWCNGDYISNWENAFKDGIIKD